MSAGLTGLFPSTEETAELQAAGWSVVATTSKMACVRDAQMLPWDEALAHVRSERAKTEKGRR